MAPLDNILIVDDEEELTSALVERLELRGYHAVGALSGRDAIAAMEKTRFDAAVLDVRLKGEDGIDVMRDLHRVQPDLPVILLTGHVSLGAGEIGTPEGAADILLKPVHLDTLVERLQSAAVQREEEGS